MVAQIKRRNFASEKEVSAMTGIPRGTLRQWRCQGKGPAFYQPEGRKVLYDTDEVFAYLEKSKRVPSVRAHVRHA